MVNGVVDNELRLEFEKLKKAMVDSGRLIATVQLIKMGFTLEQSQETINKICEGLTD